jgi:predicted HicB family RNase H-like nuclease
MPKRKQGRPRVGGVTIYTTVPRAMHAEIKRRAAADGRSMASWIQRALVQAVQQGGK